MLSKKLLIGLAAAGLCSVAFANGDPGYQPVSYSGAYLGVQGGYAIVNEGNGFKDAAQFIANGIPIFPNGVYKKDEGKLGGRAYFGWRFNKYIGVETGYAIFDNNKYTGYNSLIFSTAVVKYTAKVSASVWDIMVKGMIPFNKFDLYAKLGAGYVMSKVNSSISVPFLTIPAGTYKNKAWRPAYGAGIDYNFDKHWGIDLGWTGYYGKDKTSFAGAWPPIKNIKKFVPTINLFSLGLHVAF